MNFGCAAIWASGRPAAARSVAVGFGMRMKRSSAIVTSAKPISAR